MPRYLVTGGAGFIGSNLVAELVKRGESVRVLDNLSTGRRVNIEKFADQIDLIEGDIRSYHIVREAVDGIDYVLHQAALPSVPRSVRDPITSNEVNVIGTLNLLQAARDANVKRMVFASSSSVYGNNAQLPKSETMCPSPMSPYAVSKLAGEHYCSVFWQLYRFETVCLRYFNVFGPGQDPSSQYSAVIPKFATALLRNQSIRIFGDGTQSRDFTYVTNVVNANLLACTAERAPGKIMNIACGQRFSLLELAQELARLCGREPKLEFLPSRPGDVPHSMASIELARETIGYEPALLFSEGLKNVLEWYDRLMTEGVGSKIGIMVPQP